MFIVATIDLSFNLYHNIFAFVFFTGQGGAAAVFDELSSWVEVVRVSILSPGAKTRC